MKRTATIGILACMLSACYDTDKLASLRDASLSGSAFDQALAARYLAFAEAEFTNYDWWSVSHFSDKGLRAAKGETVLPELVESWDIPQHAVDELNSAAHTLNAKLTDNLKQSDPKRAALLQFSFDCWLEEQEEAWEQAAIDRCRDDFYRQLNESDAPVAVGGPLSTSYLVYFPWDSTQIEQFASDELRDIAKAMLDYGSYSIVINGHADRSGGDDYNMALSQRRADFIREFLVSKGIPPERIEYYAFGESDPKIDTPDNMREAANRRVEIFIE